MYSLIRICKLHLVNGEIQLKYAVICDTDNKILAAIFEDWTDLVASHSFILFLRYIKIYAIPSNWLLIYFEYMVELPLC